MLKKILKISLSLAFACVLCLIQKQVYAESVIESGASFQKIKIEKNDFNRWIQTPSQFTSIAVQSDLTENLKVVFNPYNPIEKEFIFEDDDYSELIFTNPTKSFLITTENSKQPDNLIVYLFDTRENLAMKSNFSAGNTDLNGLTIISRSQWGADESLRYYDPEELEDDDSSSGEGSLTADCQAKVDQHPEEFKYAKTIATENGNALIWPLQYSAGIKKIIVHHTGETDVTNGRPSDEMIRAIYYYHTVVKGWGDIGYNYVIGKDGEIFEGKAGGDKVVGAHVYCNNINTVGVSVMGNFNLEKPSTKQINSLKALLAQLTKKYNVDPDGTSEFHGENSQNILGHRDLAATACPGNSLYNQLPLIRNEVAKGFTYNFTETTSTTSQKEYDAEVGKKIEVLKLDPTHQQKVVFNFKNTGTQTWNDTTWLHVALNNNTDAWAETIVPDKKYVAADMKEESVKPGQTASFEVTVNAGYKSGFYILEFAPVVNNKYKLSKSAILQPIDIAEANYSYAFIKAQHPPNPFYAEQTAEAWVELKNTGNIVWRNYGENKIYLGTQKPQDRKSLFSSDGRRTRLGYLNEREVYPGQVGKFVMPLTAPERQGIYSESFAPVIEGVRWLENKGMQFRIVVKEPKHQIQFSANENLLNLNPESEKSFTITYQNLSDVSWTADQVYFVIGGDYQKMGIENNIVQLSEPLLKGKKGSFNLRIQTPLQGGLYKLTVVPVIRGKKFENSSPFTLQVLVKKSTASGKVLENPSKIIELNLNETKTVTIKILNNSNFTWKKAKTKLVTLSPKSRLYVKDKWISAQIASEMNELNVAPGKVATFTLYLEPKYRGYFTDIFKIKIDEIGNIPNVSIPLRVRAGQTNSETNSTNSTTTTVETPDLGVSATTEKNLIRVKLSVPETDTTELTANQSFSIEDANQKKLFSVTGGEKASIKKVGNYLHIQVGSVNKVSTIVRFLPENGGILEISSWEHRPAWNQSLNDNRFRGRLELRIVDNELVVINELPLEDYLKGIAEVSNNDPTEKLKTMAVLARTYALFYLQPENEKFPGKPYDASDDPDIFQKYLGYGLELRSPNFVKAIEATKNQVVTYQDKLVKTPYFNQSDGKTLSAKEVWGWTNTPYLISVDDPDCLGLTRNGHGVGLSGYGATKKAQRGENYQEIIKYYYKGVEIKTQ